MTHRRTRRHRERSRCGSAAGAGGGVNVAAASAGATASASSTYSSGLRPRRCDQWRPRGRQLGRGRRLARCHRRAVPRLAAGRFRRRQDHQRGPRLQRPGQLHAPVEPTTTQTFSQYGVTSFTVQYWDGAQWLTVPGGAITGNQQVWRTVDVPGRHHVAHPHRGHRRLGQVQPRSPRSRPIETGPRQRLRRRRRRQRRGRECRRHGLGVVDLQQRLTAPPARSTAIARAPTGAAAGGWNDATGGQFPDWLQVDFAGAQDHQRGPRLHRPGRLHRAGRAHHHADLFAIRRHQLHGAVLGWCAVADRPGGAITGNRNVWRTVTFPAVTTARIRVLVTGASDRLQPHHGSRSLREWDRAGARPAPQRRGRQCGRHGLGLDDATAAASARPVPSMAIARAPTGARAAAGTTPPAGSFPDWLQIDFAGAKTISEVRVFTVQDNYARPVEPTTDPDVQPVRRHRASRCSTGTARSG